MNPKLKKALQYTAAVIVTIFWLPFLAVVLTWGYSGIGIKRVGHVIRESGYIMERSAHRTMDFMKGINIYIRGIIWGANNEQL